VSRTEGITEEELHSLRGVAIDRTGGRFSEREMLALAYADAVTTSNTIEDGLFEMVRRHFSEDEIIELTATIAWEICAAKFNRALEIEWGGQSACPLPVVLS
jgi:alkylhydroperoxidase family enzyme